MTSAMRKDLEEAIKEATKECMIKLNDLGVPCVVVAYIPGNIMPPHGAFLYSGDPVLSDMVCAKVSGSAMTPSDLSDCANEKPI